MKFAAFERQASTAEAMVVVLRRTKQIKRLQTHVDCRPETSQARKAWVEVLAFDVAKKKTKKNKKKKNKKKKNKKKKS